MGDARVEEAGPQVHIGWNTSTQKLEQMFRLHAGRGLVTPAAALVLPDTNAGSAITEHAWYNGSLENPKEALALGHTVQDTPKCPAERAFRCCWCQPSVPCKQMVRSQQRKSALVLQHLDMWHAGQRDAGMLDLHVPAGALTHACHHDQQPS